MIHVQDPNCDGEGPHGPRQGPKNTVRVLPTGGDSNAILCRFCFGREIAWRMERNRNLSAEVRFALPLWEDLAIYNGAA